MFNNLGAWISISPVNYSDSECRVLDFGTLKLWVSNHPGREQFYLSCSSDDQAAMMHRLICTFVIYMCLQQII